MEVTEISWKDRDGWSTSVCQKPKLWLRVWKAESGWEASVLDRDFHERIASSKIISTLEAAKAACEDEMRECIAEEVKEEGLLRNTSPQETGRTEQGAKRETLIIPEDIGDYIDIPADGSLPRWKREERKRGKIAGRVNNRGYRVIGFRSKLYLYHRIVFFYHHGACPHLVDHIDGDPGNNNLNNLRAATPGQNQFNRRANSDSSSQYKGVSYDKRLRKWKSHCSVDGKRKYLGLFESEIEAALAYDRVATRHHGEYALLNKPTTS